MVAVAGPGFSYAFFLSGHWAGVGWPLEWWGSYGRSWVLWVLFLSAPATAFSALYLLSPPLSIDAKFPLSFKK